jgi:hypothetical protein
MPSLRIAIPALATAAAALAIVAIVVSGGDDGGGGGETLEVAVKSEGPSQSGALAAPQAAPETFGAPPAPGAAAPGDSAVDRSGGAFLFVDSKPGKVTVQYLFAAPATAKVELAGREAEVTVEQGSGSLEISTEGLPSGTQELIISTPNAPTFRAQVTVR